MDSASNKIVVVGSRKISGITTNAFRYDPATGLTEDLNSVATPFFTNVDPSSTLNSIVGFSCPSGCSQAISTTGNMVAGTGGSTASNFTHIVKNCTIGGTLPIKLISFTQRIQNNKVILNWEISEGEDGSSFETQKSNDGNNFYAINSQLGDMQKKLFSFIDPNLASSISYYRLKMVDKNGKVTYSDVLRVSNNKDATISVYPNPVKAGSLVQISIGHGNIESWKLVSMTGQVILKSDKPILGSTSFQAPNMPGMYILEIKTNVDVSLQKVIVQ
jgi:hypothetical protein